MRLKIKNLIQFIVIFLFFAILFYFLLPKEYPKDLNCNNPNYIKIASSFFNIDFSNYTILESSCKVSKNGFISLKVQDFDNNLVDINYSWTPCTEHQCDWSVYFKTKSLDINSLYNKLKENSCGKISVRQLPERIGCNQTISYDYSSLEKYSCVAGKYESNEGITKSMEFTQKSDFCRSWVE